MIQKPRGTLDILPPQTAVWQRVEALCRECAAEYGFNEIRFPTFEATELFARGVGGTTDVVQKEMYTFTDRDGRSMTLRPEGTACVARSVIENGLASATMPLRLYYIINCFRHEKPQAGRYREFFQFGVEMFGAPSPSADASVIALGAAVLRRIGITDVRLHINSIGCPQCRPAYHAALREYFGTKKDELCETCQGRLETNPLRILDCKSPVCSAVAAGAPKMLDMLCPDCRAHFDTLRSMLDGMGVEYEIDTKIVRGLDYYTRTVFEFVSGGIGAQSTLCGGGRYDGLIEEVGGPALAGIGFAMGLNRLVLAMEEEGLASADEAKPDIYLASMGDEAAVMSSTICELLRCRGFRAECDLVGRSLKAQMKYADRVGARYTLIIGSSEIEAKSAQLRDMSTSTQTTVALNADVIASYIAADR